MNKVGGHSWVDLSELGAEGTSITWFNEKCPLHVFLRIIHFPNIRFISRGALSPKSILVVF
jgi:hypothetical protein